jgi:hypothetical protein
MAYNLATFTDEKGNLFVEHECNSSDDKITLIRACDANKAQKLLDKVNEYLKDFWEETLKNGFYDVNGFSLGLAPLDYNGNYVDANGKNSCNVILILPEEWSKNSVEKTVRNMVDVLSEKVEMVIDDIDCNYVFLSVDFTEISLAFACENTTTKE